MDAQFITVMAVLVLAVVGGVKGYGRLQGRVDGLEKRLDDMRTTLNTIVSRLIPTSDQSMKDSSPLRLTDFGKQLAESMDADNIVKNYCSLLTPPENPTAYQIQDACFRFADNKLLDELKGDEKTKVQNVAYERGRPMGELMRILGLVFRDHFLQERGLNPPK